MTIFTQRVRTAAAACALLVAAAPAASAEDGRSNSSALHEVSVGLLDHDTDGLWSNFNREEGVDVNAELLFAPLAEVIGGRLHPALGLSINSSGDTSKAYAGVRYRYETVGGPFFGLGFGAAVHDGETEAVAADKKALGSRVLFHNVAEAGWRFTERYAASIYFDHVSNASLADENEGLDTLGLRLGYRF
ncbi:MAG: acyloxyacyl hydrolase [Marivibrio sp.]|uniref:acyloxyacyl hydrolase n=1 Tax=Marivibrio sp. TaxID=2039719 RepID=UPI0032EEACD8